MDGMLKKSLPVVAVVSAVVMLVCIAGSTLVRNVTLQDTGQTRPQAEATLALLAASAMQAEGEHNDVFRQFLRPVPAPDGSLAGLVGVTYDVSPGGGLPSLSFIALVLAGLLFGLYHAPADIVGSGQILSPLLSDGLEITLIGIVLFGLPYEWTGLLPFVALFHGWNDNLLLITGHSPTWIGFIAGYVLMFVAV